MAEIGKTNRLRVVKQVDFGVYLDGQELGEILLPKRYVPKNCHVHDMLDVFIYADSNDVLIATTEKPYAMVDECALLKVVAVNDVGAFLDWGLPKDLLVPYNQQNRPMQVGRSYVVFVYLDENTDRIAASSKYSHFLSETSDEFAPGEKVNVLICGQTELGYKAIINNTHLGLLYKNEVFTELKYGQRLDAWIKHIRKDKKIDLGLQNTATIHEELTDRILAYLKEQGGTASLTDKSPPEDIYAQFGVSKANYKKALGRLYKQKKILIEKFQITLV